MQRALSKVFGTANDRTIKRILPLAVRVASLEPDYEQKSDLELAALTPVFRQRLEAGESLDDLLPEAFAVVREAAKRTLGQRHYDVQVIGGIMLHQGRISEMKTGEGKTLVATLPSYLNGLSGDGVHIVTVNDYLAKRDAEWMGEVHRFLGLTVGNMVHGMDDVERRDAYDCDITYCTNNELGFDYLRDNMKLSATNRVQRELNYAIIDEVDSILIDEARTPLIISGPSEEDTQLYGVVNRVIPSLKPGTKGEPAKDIEETGDYWLDEKSHSATLTEAGIHKVEKMLNIDNLYDPNMLPVNHAISQALVAHTLKRLDVDYMVAVGESGKKEVIIVDEHTGRPMPGRRWSDGLHQAVEAKEGITVRSENQTLATVTFQNFFRMYNKISGMTGTADTEAPEFAKIYNLDVSLIPTHRPMSRDDLSDVVFKTKREKFNAVADEIAERQEHGQPVLVGTISIETSEMLSRQLKKRGIKHNVLNAKHHEHEASIVAQAGSKAAVTISTNMAGRGTDIVLGGNPEVLALEKCHGDKDDEKYVETLMQFERLCQQEQKEVIEAGGLHILGTERHESRRIDNQLRGRSGRQGDPGSSQFFLSLEDDLLRIFEADKVSQWWDRVGVEDGEAIENRMLTRVIEGAQKKVEARNFDMRKHLLDYDDVMNKQRQAFYARRLNVLLSDSLQQEIADIVEGIVVIILGEHWPQKGAPEGEEIGNLIAAVDKHFGVTLVPDQAPFVDADGVPHEDGDAFGRDLLDLLNTTLAEKKAQCEEMGEQYKDMGYPNFEFFERDILLQVLDTQWKDHLHTMDGLREGIGLRGYAQKDPKVEYQREGFALFAETEQRMDDQAADVLFRFALPTPRIEATQNRGRENTAATPDRAKGPQRNKGSDGGTPGKIGRNDPCPCGSGKKYKKCCAP
ncbi:MAG: preprotein translocase subunit SecA [Deltaproteobacteria bacterium]|nr:preprotein translocase subunit SecA [Deltaproteobacteria bacterium]